MYTLKNHAGNVIKTTNSNRKRERLVQEGWIDITPSPKQPKEPKASKEGKK